MLELFLIIKYINIYFNKKQMFVRLSLIETHAMIQI